MGVWDGTLVVITFVVFVETVVFAASGEALLDQSLVFALSVDKRLNKLAVVDSTVVLRLLLLFSVV